MKEITSALNYYSDMGNWKWIHAYLILIDYVDHIVAYLINIEYKLMYYRFICTGKKAKETLGFDPKTNQFVLNALPLPLDNTPTFVFQLGYSYGESLY